MDKTAGTLLFTYCPGRQTYANPFAAPERDLALRHPDLGFADGRHDLRHRPIDRKAVRNTFEQARRGRPVVLVSHQHNLWPLVALRDRHHLTERQHRPPPTRPAPKSTVTKPSVREAEEVGQQ